MKQYKCKHFKLYELVDKATWKNYGQFAWNFLDPRLLMALDQLRDALGPITVNDWKWGGKFQWRGLRTTKCRQGAGMSQHRFGRAVDFDVKGMTPQDVRNYIRTHFEDFGIFCIERKVNWIHMDVRNCNPLKEVSP